jgi:hypothetical protein
MLLKMLIDCALKVSGESGKILILLVLHCLKRYFLNLLAKSRNASLFLPIKSPMNAPAIKQIIRLVMEKKEVPTKFTICSKIPVAPRESTITAQMQKPTMDAPANINVALLSYFMEGLNSM